MENTQLTPELTHLLHVYDHESQSLVAGSNEPKIQVNEVIGYLSFIYEKTRNVVEFAEEHVLRKNSIKRILRRKLIESDDPYQIAASLLRELVRSRQLANNTIPESKINDVANVVIRYRAAREQISAQLPLDDARRAKKFVMEITVTEIDDMLVSKEVEYAFVNYQYNTLAPIISLPEMAPEIKDIQVFIATLASLMNLDDEMIAYHLVGVVYPHWFQYTHELSPNFIAELTATMEQVNWHLNFKLRRKLLNNVNKYSAYFTTLRDALETDRAKFIELATNPLPEVTDPFAKKPETFDQFLEGIVSARQAAVKAKLLTRAIRAFLYVLATKIIVSLLIEVPADLFLEGHINYITLIINLVFPLVLILLMAFTVQMPRRDNTLKLIEGVKDLVFQEVDSEAFAEEKIVEVRQGTISNVIFLTLYGLLSAAIYGLIIWGLFQLDFNLVSGIIFLLLVSTISYFGIIMRQPVRRLRVVKARENVFTFLMQLLSLPILRVGRTLSENFSKINVFVYILDVLIEAPFKVLVEAFEEWSEYLRNKREEIY